MSRNCCPPADPIILSPITAVENFYHPQLVQVIQPIEIVHNHHCVPVYQHLVSYSFKDVGPYDAAISTKKSGNKQRRKTKK